MFCDADHSFPAAFSVKGMRGAFLSVKESFLLKPGINRKMYD